MKISSVLLSSVAAKENWQWPQRNNTDNPNGFANKLVDPGAQSCIDFFAQREVEFEHEVAADGKSGTLGISFHGNGEECIQRVEEGFEIRHMLKFN